MRADPRHFVYNLCVRRVLAVLAIVCASLIYATSSFAASGDLRIGTAQPFDSPSPFQSANCLATSSFTRSKST